MNIRKLNWQVLAGFLLSIIAFLSYALVFVRFPMTRDFPWANLLLFAIATALLLVGLRRAFAPNRGPQAGSPPVVADRTHPRRSKILASVLATFSVLILGFFVFSIFIMSRWLPASHGAPQVGQKAPDFSLNDTNGKTVSLSELLSSPIDGETGNVSALAGNEQKARTTPKGVLLIFYRGYW